MIFLLKTSIPWMKVFNWISGSDGGAGFLHPHIVSWRNLRLCESPVQAAQRCNGGGFQRPAERPIIPKTTKSPYRWGSIGTGLKYGSLLRPSHRKSSATPKPLEFQNNGTWKKCYQSVIKTGGWNQETVGMTELFGFRFLFPFAK